MSPAHDWARPNPRVDRARLIDAVVRVHEELDVDGLGDGGTEEGPLEDEARLLRIHDVPEEAEERPVAQGRPAAGEAGNEADRERDVGPATAAEAEAERATRPLAVCTHMHTDLARRPHDKWQRR